VPPPKNIFLEGTGANDIYDQFADTIRFNAVFINNLKLWLSFHSEEVIEKYHSRPPGEYTLFSQKEFESNKRLRTASSAVEIDLDDLGYTFDVILKYLSYGKALTAAHYISHYLREEFAEPILVCTTAPGRPFVAKYSFADYFVRLSKTHTIEEWCRFLAETRIAVSSRTVHYHGAKEIEELNRRLWENGLPQLINEKLLVKTIAIPLIAGAGAMLAGPGGALAATALVVEGPVGDAVRAGVGGIVKKGWEMVAETLLPGVQYSPPAWAAPAGSH
jgi:hypothetical protein